MSKLRSNCILTLAAFDYDRSDVYQRGIKWEISAKIYDLAYVFRANRSTSSFAIRAIE